MKSFSELLHNRSLLIIGASESVSNTGNWITMMAVFAMLVFKGSGGVAQSSGVFLAGLIPTLLVSPFAGWLLDRFDRKWLMISSELFSGLIILGLVFTSNLFLIYAILALQAVSISIMTPARQAVVPDLSASQSHILAIISSLSVYVGTTRLVTSNHTLCSLSILSVSSTGCSAPELSVR